MTKEKVVIIGVGNVLRSDDGVGVIVAKELSGRRSKAPQRPLPEGVEVYDGGSGGFRLLDLLDGFGRAIFIDAIDMGSPPGTVRAFSPQEVISLLATGGRTLHGTDLLEVLKFVEAFDDALEVKIVGIQPADVGYGLELSAPLKGSVPRAIGVILDLI